jgi:hypothetical protein
MEKELKISKKDNEIFATTCHGTFRIAKVDSDIDPYFKSEIINYLMAMVEVKKALEAWKQVGLTMNSEDVRIAMNEATDKTK